MSRSSKRWLVLISGSALLALGVPLLVLPGPGLPITFAGLSVLATEFPLARLWLRRLRQRMKLLTSRFRPSGVD